MIRDLEIAGLVAFGLWVLFGIGSVVALVVLTIREYRWDRR